MEDSTSSARDPPRIQSPAVFSSPCVRSARDSERPAQPGMMAQSRASRGIELDLDQVDAPRRAAGQSAGGILEARELLAPEPHPGPEALSAPPGLDLDEEQRPAVAEDEVDLAPASRTAPRDEVPPSAPEPALRQPLARAREARVAGGETRQRPARRPAPGDTEQEAWD